MTKVFAYLRVSTKGQIGGSGFERQADRIKKFCVSQNWEIKKMYREQASGAKDETERPVWSEMMNDLLSNGVTIVVIESLDRLARTIGVQELLVTYLASKNIDLWSANTQQNISEAIREDPMKELLIYMQAVIAKWERNQITLRMKKGRERVKQLTGRCSAPLRYGSTPEEAEILKRISYMRRLSKNQKRRRSYQSIADTLNNEGILSRQGKQWSAAGLYHIHQRGGKK